MSKTRVPLTADDASRAERHETLIRTTDSMRDDYVQGWQLAVVRLRDVRDTVRFVNDRCRAYKFNFSCNARAYTYAGLSRYKLLYVRTYVLSGTDTVS